MKKIMFIVCVLCLSASALVSAEVLKIQYIEDYAPLSFKENGNVVGIYPDMVSELNRRLGEKDIRITAEKPVLVPIKRIMKNLEEGNIDLIVGMTKTKAREEIFQYASTPVLNPEMTFAKLVSDHTEYIDTASLQGKMICTLAGSNASKNISQIKGLAGVSDAYDIPTCLKMLAAHRVDAVYFHNFALLYYLKAMNLGDRITLIEKPFKTKVYHICFSKKVKAETLAEIDKAAAAMIQDGSLKKIIESYR